VIQRLQDEPGGAGLRDDAPQDLASSPARARTIAGELAGELGRRMPGWKAPGVEDPLWVLLECFALRLARLEAEVEGLGPKLLDQLSTRWEHDGASQVPLRTFVRLVPDSSHRQAVRVPAGTGLTSTSRSRSGWRWSFELAADAWLSPARLVRVLAMTEAGAVDLPIGGADSQRLPGPGAGVDLWRGADRDRHLYLGDAAWENLRGGAEAILEWPGAPALVADGLWEYSTGGTWRRLPAEFAEAAGARAGRVLRMRIRGPLGDFAEEEIDGRKLCWLRLALEGPGRRTLEAPRLVWFQPPPGQASDAAQRAAPRPVARILSRAPGLWLDHSLAAEGRLEAARTGAEDEPAVYLGWDQPLPASLFWEAASPPPPRGFALVRLRWEHSAPDGFLPLAVRDGTLSFAQSGTISWGVAREWTAETWFGQRLFWVRARWVDGSYFSTPRLRAVHPSAVEVAEGSELRDVPLRARSLSGTRLRVEAPVEGNLGSFDQLDVLVEGQDARRLHRAPDGSRPGPGQFAVFRRGASSYGDGGIDLELGRDLPSGAELRVPLVRHRLHPRGRDPLRLPPATLAVIEADLPGLGCVEQPEEAVEARDAFSRPPGDATGSGSIASGLRAVSAEDYRRLAFALCPQAARVEVVPPGPLGRETVVVVVQHSQAELPPLSAAALQWIEDRIQGRAPLGSVVRVTEPSWLSYRVTVVAESAALRDAAGRAAGEIEARVRAFLDPIHGGPKGTGYPLGKGLRAEDLRPIIFDFVGVGAGQEESGEELEVDLRIAVECTSPRGSLGSTVSSGGAVSSASRVPEPPPPLSLPRLESLDVCGEDRAPAGVPPESGLSMSSSSERGAT
jgi:hypothetical protein